MKKFIDAWVYGSDPGEPWQVGISVPILTDRSRYVTGLVCEQKRWLDYNSGPQGLGLSSNLTYDDLALGTAVHLGMEAAMQAWARAISEHEEMDSRELAIAAYDVADYSFRQSASQGLVMSGDPHMGVLNPELYQELLEEQAALAGLLAGAGVAVWLPQVMEEYDLVATEQEIDWCIAGDWQVVMMSRPDAVLRRKSDGKIFVVSYKTTKTFYSSDLDRIRYDIQALTEMAAVSAKGLDPAGVLYVFFIKGSRKKLSSEDSSYQRYGSSLLRPWVDPRLLAPILRTRYESLPDPMTGRKTRLGPNFDQLSFTEGFGVYFGQYGITPRDYFIRLLDGEFDEENGGVALEQVIAAPEPILRSRDEMNRIVRQIALDESAWDEKLSELPGDDFFRQARMNPNSCYNYNRPCPWVGACWGTGTAEVQRLIATGRMAVRVPNHEQEVDDE